MQRIEIITMAMRELDRLKANQAVIDGLLKPARTAKRLGLTSRQIQRPVIRVDPRQQVPCALCCYHEWQHCHARSQMSDRPEDRDLVKFILDNGGPPRAALKIVIRDRFKALVNLNFWALLLNSAFIFGYMTIIFLGTLLSLAYFLYAAFWSDSASMAERKDALITVAVVAVLVGSLAYMSWKDRRPK